MVSMRQNMQGTNRACCLGKLGPGDPKLDELKLDLRMAWLAFTSQIMPRLPLPTFQFALAQRAPARSISACRPRISATATHRSLFCHPRTFHFSPSPRLVVTPIRRDQYTPQRIPNAAWPYLYHPFDKMAHLEPYFKQVDALQGNFIERLREAVAIPSISSEDQRRPDVVRVRTKQCIWLSAWTNP
jgi:hypothetical protein